MRTADGGTYDPGETTDELALPTGEDAEVTLRHAPAPGPVHDPLPQLTIGEALAGGALPGPDLAVVRVLGEGGMGVVLLARQASLGRDVAIKRIRPDARTHADEALLREARVMGGLEHPNIVPVHALGLDEHGRPALVMKRIEGSSWRSLLEDPAHPGWRSEFDEAGDDRIVRNVEILSEVCRAVHFAHDRGVFHRDLKPENVMIGTFGEVYVVDWGVAGRFADEPVTTSIVGTPAFMAPELATRGAPLSPATDVYLLGGCLHAALGGRTPHAGAGVKEVVRAARHAGWLELPEAPPELGAIVVRACAPAPADRYPTAAALSNALAGWLRQRQGHALVAATRERLAALRTALAQPAPDAAERARIEALFTECRFGFTQARATVPAAAAEGLREAFEAVIPFELAHGNLDLVGAHLDALEALGASAPALREALGTARQTAERQRALAVDLDADYALRERSGWFVIAAMLMIGSAVLVVAADQAGMPYGHREAIGAMLALTALVPAGLWWTRRWMLGNRVNRGFAIVLMAGDLAILLHRLVSARFDAPIAEMLSTDLLLFAQVALAAGLLDPRYYWGVAFFVLGAVLIAVFPGARLSLFGSFAALGILVAGAAFVRDARRRAG